MNLKKLSIAAALSIGVMTVSAAAIADQLQPQYTGAACPVCPPQQQVVQQPIQMQQTCPSVVPSFPVGAACPVCPTQQMQSVYSPIVANPVAPMGSAMCNQAISGCVPNIAPNAHVIERQAFGFPDIGDAGLIIPKGNEILQIGGDKEAIALSTTCPSALATVPARGPVLNLASKDSLEGFTSGVPYAMSPAMPGLMGAASPLNQCGCGPCGDPVTGFAAPASGLTAYPCAQKACDIEQITQGVEILRCGIPEQQGVLQAYYSSPCFKDAGILGAAVPIQQPCPIVDPCSPCQPCPTGPAAPIIQQVPVQPCDPCNPIVPAIPLSSLDLEENIVPVANVQNEVPCDYMEPCPTGAACPIAPPPQRACPEMPPVQVCPEPCPTGAAVPIQPCPVVQPCPTGFAAQPCGPCQEQYQGPRRIQTSSGIQMQKNVLVPVQVPVTIPCPTGAGCPVGEQYPDVSNAMPEGCDINKLTAQGILAGYPDRTYKPNLPIMRDEFASALVGALELENVPDFQQQIFRDVPNNHWANQDIDKTYNRGLLAGFPNNMFKPDHPVTRAEVLSTLSKVIPGEISSMEAQQILSCYTDSNEIPGWAAMSVAESLNSGLIKNLPMNDQIKPNDSASRAEVATILDEVRQVLGLEPQPQTTGAATQLQPGIATSTIPTLKMRFEDIISARTSEIDDRFVAKTTEPVSIDGQLFPEGSEVHGEVVEVIRPNFDEPGAIRVEFDEIRYECDGDATVSTQLPRDIISAVVVEEDNPNILGRVVAWPFSWPGKVAGVLGRTVGGATITAANMTETFFTNVANGNNELLNLEGAAAGRSYLRAIYDIPEGVYYTGKTLVSGTLGVVKVTGDELAYIVSPDGDRIAQINPDEVLSVAFGAK